MATLTAVGLVTSLGHDVVTAAAAARAGIVRPAPLATLVADPETNDPQPVTGHPVDGLADGFEGAARLLRLVELGLADLGRSAPAETLRRAHWLIALPEPLPTAPPLPLPDPDAEPEVDPPEVPVPGPARLDAERVRAVAERVIGAPVPPSRFAAFEGRTGFVRALGHAQHLAERGTPCVVGAVDSLVDRDAVTALHEHARLLATTGGAGLEPGEASVFVVVEGDDAREPLGRIGAGALGDEPDHLYTGRPALGRGLARAVGSLPAGPAVWPVSDCNGEPFRSAEWGHAVVADERLREGVGRTLYPATAVGDTGAASAGVGLALALRAFARGYAPAPSALLLAAEALGPRAVLTVDAP